MSQPKRGRSSQAQNHLITILLALVIAGLSMWFGAGRDGGNGPDAAATPVPGSGLTVTYLDVGQGDCTLLQCDGQTMLIDAGIGEQANHITTYLKQQGVKSIDYLVCTHAHADHCGGMKAVIAAFPVHTFYSSVTSSSNGAFQRVMRAAETANLTITVPGVTPRLSASCSCVNLCCLRSARMFSASLICISIPPDASIVSDTAPEWNTRFIQFRWNILILIV